MRGASWGGGLVLMLVLGGVARADSPGPELDPPPRAVIGEEVGQVALFVDETAEAVRLRIPGEEDVDPGSIEVLLAGRDVTVLARSTSGRRLRSRPVHVEAPLTEEGATASHDADGSLTVTLRKQAPPEPADR